MIGTTELLLIAALVLVLIAGSKSKNIAKTAGSAYKEVKGVIDFIKFKK